MMTVAYSYVQHLGTQWGLAAQVTKLVLLQFCFRFFSSVFLCLWVVVRVYVMCVFFCVFLGGGGGYVTFLNH